MMIDDLRHAIRRLRGRPAHLAAVIAMLGLAIGMTTAMFTLIDALVLRPVPFKEPAQLAHVYTLSGRTGRLVVPVAVFDEWRRSPAFEAVEGATAASSVLDSPAGQIMRNSAKVSAGLFRMLGVTPIRGRAFQDTEGRAGTADRVVISEDLWRGTFGGDESIVGRPITVDGQSLLVVGIMPADFRFPAWNTVMWMPIDYSARPPGSTALPAAYARLSRSMPEADALAVATAAARAADPSMATHQAVLRPLANSQLDPYYSRAIPVLAGGIVLVFLVLCANVCSLLLAQMTARRREFATSSALGASRIRLLRQALVESALIGLGGVLTGIGLAWALVAVSRGFLPEAFLLRTLNPVNLDPRSLAAASIAGVIALLVSGLLPAWIGTRVDPVGSLRVAERGGTDTRAARATTRSLLVAEIALACTLLVGATVLVRSFINLATVDRGLRTKGIMTAWVGLPPAAFKDRPARYAAAQALEAQLRALPGVRQVALSFGLPPDGGSIHFGDGWRSDLPGAPAMKLEVDSYDVRPDFFELYGIPLVRGRTFQAGDPDNAVVIGERLAELFWPGVEPVGRAFMRDKTSHIVVGVARETKLPTLDTRLDRPEFYTPFVEGGGQVMASLLCAAACPSIPMVRQQILAVSPAIRISGVGMLDDLYTEQLARPRAAAALGVVFACVAVVTSTGGLFSVLSYSVGRRRREFGIRVALGASPRQVRGLVFRDGVRVTVIGVTLGTAGAWALARSLAALSYGVTPGDPLTWVGVLSAIAATTMIAAWRPAQQAAGANPAGLLRE